MAVSEKSLSSVEKKVYDECFKGSTSILIYFYLKGHFTKKSLPSKAQGRGKKIVLLFTTYSEKNINN